MSGNQGTKNLYRCSMCNLAKDGMLFNGRSPDGRIICKGCAQLYQHLICEGLK